MLLPNSFCSPPLQEAWSGRGNGGAGQGRVQGWLLSGGNELGEEVWPGNAAEGKSATLPKQWAP